MFVAKKCLYEEIVFNNSYTIISNSDQNIIITSLLCHDPVAQSNISTYASLVYYRYSI